ncbi:hypothetical protein LTR22_020015 [Elasticomyces elasticus]|nr:hypothetical protein LTR22_020015 [Elasticomyces elasticus]
MAAALSQYSAKPKCFMRTTHSRTRTKYNPDVGFGQRTASSDEWPDTLSRQMILDHLDKTHVFSPNEGYLTSVHAVTDNESLERAKRYATTQRDVLFFDDTYKDPDVWTHTIECNNLQWETVELKTGVHINAQSVFGLHSRWAIKDEWFAVGNIPKEYVVRHAQLAHNTLPPERIPYKLVPIPHALHNLPIEEVSWHTLALADGSVRIRKRWGLQVPCSDYWLVQGGRFVIW